MNLKDWVAKTLDEKGKHGFDYYNDIVDSDLNNSDEVKPIIEAEGRVPDGYRYLVMEEMDDAYNNISFLFYEDLNEVKAAIMEGIEYEDKEDSEWVILDLVEQKVVEFHISTTRKFVYGR